MSEAASPNNTPPTEPTALDSNGTKRPAPEETNENRETKTVKLESTAAENTNQQTTEESHDSPEVQESPASPQLPQEEPPTAPHIARPLLSIQQHPPHPHPPAALHLLTESQQHQLIQHYVQAQGHPDLANLTASSLAQAMVSPIAVPALATNLLQQLQQGGNIITALPGPPPQIPHHPHPISNTSASSSVPDLTDGGMVAGSKRVNSRSLSNDERRQRRLLRNRVAAKECRKKKKQHIHEMEEKIEKLEKENANLTKEVEELKAKLSLGAMQGPEGYRLMKEVEELNAKLGMSGALASNINMNPSSLNTTPPTQSSDTQPKENEEKEDESKQAKVEEEKKEVRETVDDAVAPSEPTVITSEPSAPAVTATST
ncbi:hypothetical protein EDC96DRAFT_574300 [Choanephora cucurbitarum]|nr:hypothetical protein EDC96DRAFT_574300 [Choanephora cucurbitarum]